MPADVVAPRILHILDHSVPLHSGYAFRTNAILREQQRLGWQTEQLTSPKHYGAEQDEETVDGLHFFRTRSPKGGWRTLPVLDQWAVINDTRRRLEEVMQRFRPDILHAHSPCLNGIAALRAARPRRIPVVYEMRSSWEDAAVDHGTTKEGSLRYKLSRRLETWTLQKADAVTTICDGLRRDIVARGLSEERVTVIPNAVDPSDFVVPRGPDTQLKAQLGLEDAFTVGFVGSFYGYEGLDLLLDAVPAILGIEPRARILLVGGGVEEQRLKVQARGLGISDRVVFAGRVPHAKVARYYSIMDLLVYPRKSMRLTETVTPLKPLEAMAQGRLLAASDVGGHRELVADGVTGYLFAPDSPQAVAGAVQRVMDSQADWPSMRLAGRRLVEQERNWTRSVGRYAAVYHAVTSNVAMP